MQSLLLYNSTVQSRPRIPRFLYPTLFTKETQHLTLISLATVVTMGTSTLSHIA